MAERKLQRLLNYGDDDVDTHMSPMRGETYRLATWGSATLATESRKTVQQQHQQQPSAASPEGQLQAASPSLLPQQRPNFGSGYVSPTDSGATAVMKRSRQLALETQRNEASWAVKDPPVLLCTTSSILENRKPSEWERPTRTGIHNLIRDYKPNADKNLAVMKALDHDVEAATKSVSGLPHRLQLRADIPTGSRVFLNRSIVDISATERGDLDSPFYPSELSTKLASLDQKNKASKASAFSVNSALLRLGAGQVDSIHTKPTEVTLMTNSQLGMALLSLPSLGSQSQHSKQPLLELARQQSDKAGQRPSSSAQISSVFANGNKPSRLGSGTGSPRVISMFPALGSLAGTSPSWVRKSPDRDTSISCLRQPDTIRETAQLYRQHGDRAGVAANPQNSLFLGTASEKKYLSDANHRASPFHDREEELQAALATVNYPEKYRELSVLQDQQDIRAEIYDGFRKDYDNHVKYVGSVMEAMSQGNFSTTIHDKSLLVPTHNHKVLQLMSRLRRETVPIMFVKHEDEGDGDDGDEDSSESDAEEEARE